MALYAPTYAPKTNQPLNIAVKWLLINERETRFELATLSLGSYKQLLIIYTYRLLKPLLSVYLSALYLLSFIVDTPIFIIFV